MLLISKLIALGVVIWFYVSAEKVNQPAVKWAVIGLIGYVIVWFLFDKVIADPLSAKVVKKGIGMFIIYQIPPLGGLAAAYLIRKKLLSEAGAPPK